MRPIYLLISSLAVTTTLISATPDKTQQLLAAGKEPIRIVCIGDSITGVYYHTGGLRAYPEMLEIALHKIYPQAQVTMRNAGISGDTTKGALARLDRDVLAHKPHLVTVMFGMNDMVRTPLAEFQSNLKEIIARCRQAGAEVLLCTQNSVVDTEARPSSKLAEFTQAIRDVGKQESLGVVDCYAIYEAVRAKDKLEWSLLHSDEIHPNMDGHKVFASAIAQAISGKAASLKDVGPPEPAMRHTLALLKEGKPIKVLAMPPYDQLIGPALTRLYPGAKVTVTAWPTEGQSLAQLEVAAKKVRAMAMDLVLIAVPSSAKAEDPEDFHKHYSWIMNWSLSFGPQQWDVVVVPPPPPGIPKLTASERLHEDFARRLIVAQDLHMLTRPQSDKTTLPELLATWLTELVQRTTK
ncbi:SGNH/GDSL hydrolase family protein [Prosthecobacter sp.]|uniref:SGNH/GDSL hydrolase family protein n=1 Tax=Prosthecobacter sp. TaxID=1965333 RepID=UPI002AC93569|nr:SGNH/GDSL hydrolase family protein [Prosthecobacter sp.]